MPNPLVSNLSPGQELDYKELITLLDEEYLPPQGNSRKAQLKQFQRMFSFEKGPGRKYTIKEIYKEPLPSQDRRLSENASRDWSQSRRGKYYEPIEQITLRYFSSLGNPLLCTPRQLLKLYGIVNEEYRKEDWYTLSHWQSFSDLTYEDYNLFYDREYHMLRPMLERQLNALAHQGKIEWHHQTQILSRGIWHEADPQQESQIEEGEQSVLSSIGLNRSEVFYRRQTDAYYKELFRYLSQEYNIERFIPYMRIEILQPGEIMDEEEYHTWQKKMNRIVLSTVKENIRNVYANREAQFERGALSEENGDYRYSEDYIEIQNRMADRFIKID